MIHSFLTMMWFQLPTLSEVDLEDPNPTTSIMSIHILKMLTFLLQIQLFYVIIDTINQKS